MAFFVVCLVALGVSFFFGLMAGLSGRAGAAVRAAGGSESQPTPVGVMPDASTSPAEPRPGSASGSAAGGPGEEPTPPAVLQAFEDHAAEPTSPPAATKRPAPAPVAAAPAASGVWIQVASVASRAEADAMAGRISHRGYRAQVVAAQSPKGKVFRVRVGPYRSEQEAALAAEKLRTQEKIRQTWIVREGH